MRMIIRKGTEKFWADVTCHNCALHTSHRGGICRGKEELCDNIHLNYMK